MDATVSWLGIFTLCCSLPMIFFSVRRIIRERRHDREGLPPSDPRPHWYMNFVIRQGVGTVFFLGGLLLIGSGYYFVMLNRKLQSFSLIWLLFSFCFLNAIYRIYTTISEEYERCRVTRLAGETQGRWRASLKLHRGLAAASFWVGMPLPWLLIGWDAVSRLSSNPMDVYFWLAGICAGLSGLYWLGTSVLEFLLVYRRGGWVAVEHWAMARQPLSSQVMHSNSQPPD